MSGLMFKFVKFALRSQYKKPVVLGEQNFDSSTPAIFLSNHERFYGPIMITTRFPIPVRQWATSMMIDLEDTKVYVKETLFMDTLNMKEGISKVLGDFAAHPISWAVRNANPVPAYWDAKRAPMSIKYGIDAIKNGENQLMYAPNRKPYDDNFEFMQGFIMLAKFSQKILGIAPNIYPLAINKAKNAIAICKPTSLNPSMPFKEESDRINAYVKDQICKAYENPEIVNRYGESLKQADTTDVL